MFAGPEAGIFWPSPPPQITIADILRAVEEPLAPEAKNTTCQQEPSTGQRIDDLLLNVLWSRLTDQIRQILESVTLADLVSEWEKSSPPGFMEHRFVISI